MTSNNSSSAEQKAEQNMDKVLDSIKDVITNNSAEPNKNVLELTEKVTVDHKSSAANSDSSNDDILNKIDNSLSEGNRNKQDQLLNESAAQESKNVLKDLIKMTGKSTADQSNSRGGTSLEDLVIGILKPELSLWLNNNLPNIVTAVVQKEINKLIPKDE